MSASIVPYRGVLRWNPFNPSSDPVKKRIIRIMIERISDNPDGSIG